MLIRALDGLRPESGACYLTLFCTPAPVCSTSLLTCQSVASALAVIALVPQSREIRTRRLRLFYTLRKWFKTEDIIICRVLI